MDIILKDFLDKIVVDSEAGAGGQASRKTIKGFALPRHGADMAAIDRHMLPNANSRQDAITRVIGLREFTKGHAYTSIGKKYLSKCVNKKQIIKNQFKKWHFINLINNRDKEAKDFDVYPYWITLEFLCKIKNLGLDSKLTSIDFLVFVVSIRNRRDISDHVKAYEFAKKNSSEYSKLLSTIPPDTGAKFIGGHWNQIIESGFFDHVSYNKDKESIYLEAEFDCNEFESTLETFYGNYQFDSYDDKDYIDFLQNENEDYEMFPNTDVSFDDMIDVASNIDNNFEHKNIVFKGVPGTGKSTLLSIIIKDKIFKLKDETIDGKTNPCLSKSNLIKENVLRINIHSASSNSDLMQGVGIATDSESRILYSEKQGLILKHIEKACFAPMLPFVLVLEEIQENSLNELIGDLIYLIEVSKRADISKITPFDTFGLTIDNLIERYMEEIKDKCVDYVELPSLVDPDKIKKMIFPDNLYVFCTSNYRDDKKVIEDNLLRRFDVIEIYPQYTEGYKDTTGSVSSFLSDINGLILKEFEHEVHPDRFQIGHSNWLVVEENDAVKFYKALLKIVIEFKEIREIEYGTLKTILEKLKAKSPEKGKNWVQEAFEELEIDKDYSKLINQLQHEVYKSTIFEIEPS
jgi:hypothetical protein